MAKHNEADLRKLYEFIAGRGEWGIYGGGLWTHPRAGEPERVKHDACKILEARGLVRRKLDEPDFCAWEAI